MESDVQQFVDLPPGDYEIDAFGLKGATMADAVICYSFDQPQPLSLDADQTVTLMVPFGPINDPTDSCNLTKPSHGR